MTSLCVCASRRVFDLSSNGFTGTLPDEIGQLTVVQYVQPSDFRAESSNRALCHRRDFQLHDNYLSGTIPSTIGKMAEMWYSPSVRIGLCSTAVTAVMSPCAVGGTCTTTTCPARSPLRSAERTHLRTCSRHSS